MFRNGIIQFGNNCFVVSFCGLAWVLVCSLSWFSWPETFLNVFPNQNCQFLLISFSLSFLFDDVPKCIAISFVIENLLVNCVVYIGFLQILICTQFS